MALPLIIDQSTDARAVYLVNGDPANAAVVSTSNPIPVVSTATATSPEFVKAAPYTQLGDQPIAALVTVQALTVPPGATVAFVQNTGAGVVRYRFAGAPTSSVGHQLAAGGVVTVDDGNAGLATFRAIDGTGTNSLFVSYFA